MSSTTSKAKEIAAPMFALYDTNTGRNKALQDLGISGLLENLERRAEEAARGEAPKSGQDLGASGVADHGHGEGGGRGWRRRGGRQEQSHATDAPGNSWAQGHQRTHRDYSGH